MALRHSLEGLEEEGQVLLPVQPTHVEGERRPRRKAERRAGRRVYVYNMVPSRWTLEGLNAPDRNPYRDRYEAADFEAFVEQLRRRFELVPVLKYWEESKEPLYLYGRRTEPAFEVRPRS